MTIFITPLRDVDDDALDLVGGKGANLGMLMRAGFPVPDGFCVNTRAFACFVGACDDLERHYARLRGLQHLDRTDVGRVGGALRDRLGKLEMPKDVRDEVLDAWRRSRSSRPYAVRSSATAEDLAEASFAGQHDTYLNIQGEDDLLPSIRNCWISLFSDRAIAYRARQGTDHQIVEMAVVVQELVEPEVSGVMFTADPLKGTRNTIVINATFGLGEAVVSGIVNPDLYRVDAKESLTKSISVKALAIRSKASGGVVQEEIDDSERKEQALPDGVILELAALGRRIEAHYGAPQDIEWAWADGRLHVLQSRPITSLFPVPEDPPDGRLHVYFSFGHQQAMTDAIRPLGLSLLRTYFPFGKRLPNGESTQMVQAGNRLYFDYTDPMHAPLGRAVLARAAGAMDARVGLAILEIARRPEFQEHHRFSVIRSGAINVVILRSLGIITAGICVGNMETRQARAEAWVRRALATSREAVEHSRGSERVARIQLDLQRIPMQIFYELTLTQLASLIVRRLVETLCQCWTGDTADVSVLDKSIPGNVTAEMGLAIGDLADLVRDEPALLALLQSPPAPWTPEVLASVPGGPAFAEALDAFLARYGARCSGEIDVTRPRWADEPSQLFAGVVANARKGLAGEHRARFRAGELQANQATERILTQVRKTRFGRLKAVPMARSIKVYRTLMGLREHPKFFSVQLFDIYRRAIQAELQSLLDAGVLSADDGHFLSLEELRRLLDGQAPEDLTALIAARRAAHRAFEPLTPPRLFLSSGEAVNGRDPIEREGVLVGCPVSAGVAEGRARVVLRPEDAELEDGDILVAPYTDPGWTPLFAAVRGLVLEVGGLMTHGSVIARELGIPAVVGIDDATRRIVDGEHLRIDGSQGLVEILRPAPVLD